MRTLSVLLPSLLLMAFLSVGLRGQESGKPLWTTNLQPFSYASRPNPHYIGGKPYINGKFADIGVIFRSADEVICYFVTKATGGQLEQRSELETSGPFKLQIISFAASSGGLKFAKDLPAHAGVTSVMVNSEGRLVVRTADFLRLYSTDFASYAERLLPSAWLRGWVVRPSPSGKTLGLRYSSYPSEQFEILDSTSLSAMRSPQKDHLLPFFSISETGIVQPNRDRKGLLIRGFDSVWRSLPGSESLACISNNPVFINESQLLNACGQELVLLSTSGEVLFRDRVDKNEHLEELVSVTPDGHFFAVSAMRTKGGFMDYTKIKRSRTRILVYDATSQKRISSVLVDPIPQKDYDFALAPDGSKLAVMIDNHVKVYAVAQPSSPVSSQAAEKKP